MEEKSTKIKYRREKNKHSSRIDALTEAQKIAFAPFTFQIVSAMIDFGILEFLNRQSASKKEIIENCNLSRYTVDTLFDASTCIGIIKENSDGTFSNTKLAEAFLFDEMTRVNFNFTKDVCFLGANELQASFKESRPAGLQKYFFDSETIYPMLSQLPPRMKKSWYEFDHHYSDDCFEEILPIMFSSAFSYENAKKNVFDIGGNTGKFEKACLSFDPECTVTMFDLEPNIETAKKNFDTDRCKFFAIDVLSQKPFPKISGAVLMSQFLDCFSREQILLILNKVADAIDEKTKVFILEPFIDNQQFEGAKYALSHISAYFTCMANGKSKMYNESDMTEMIEQSNLKVEKAYQGIGKYDYTLLECSKK